MAVLERFRNSVNLEDVYAPAATAIKQVVMLSRAYLTITGSVLVSPDEADSIKFFFIAATHEQNKVPRWADVWAISAKQGSGLDDQLKMCISKLKYELSSEGARVRQILTLDEDSYDEREVLGWLKSCDGWKIGLRFAANVSKVPSAKGQWIGKGSC